MSTIARIVILSLTASIMACAGSLWRSEQPAAVDASSTDTAVQPPSPPEPQTAENSEATAEASGKYNLNIKPGWYIEISSHNERLDAEIEAAAFTYRRLNPQVAAAPFNKQGRYLVIVGPFAKREYAEENMAEFAQEDLANQQPRVIEVSPVN